MSNSSQEYISGIYERMLHVRKLAGLSQEEFARKVETSRSIISQIEIGKIKPSYEVLINTSRLFKVSYAYLLEGSTKDRHHTNAEQVAEDAANYGSTSDTAQLQAELLKKENKLLRDQVAQLKELTETQRDLIEALKK